MGVDRSALDEIRDLQRRLYDLQKRVTGGAVADDLPDGPFDVLLCRVRSQPVALPLAQVEEVVPAARMSALPEAPDWICGLLHVRSLVVPVVDVVARISRAPRRLELGDLIVICRADGHRVGLVVQEVHEVRRVDPADLTDAAPDLPHAPYVLGVLQLRETTLVFSIPRLVATSDVPSLEEGEGDLPSPEAEPAS